MGLWGFGGGLGLIGFKVSLPRRNLQLKASGFPYLNLGFRAYRLALKMKGCCAHSLRASAPGCTLATEAAVRGLWKP